MTCHVLRCQLSTTSTTALNDFIGMNAPEAESAIPSTSSQGEVHGRPIQGGNMVLVHEFPKLSARLQIPNTHRPRHLSAVCFLVMAAALVRPGQPWHVGERQLQLQQKTVASSDEMGPHIYHKVGFGWVGFGNLVEIGRAHV